MNDLNPVIALLGRRIRLAVIGGGPGSFIGPIHRMAARLDDRYDIVAGVLAVLLMPGSTGILLCSLLVGITFLGTVLLTQRLGRSLQPHQGPRISAAMIALYSVMQLAGPWLAGQPAIHSVLEALGCRSI